MQISWFEKALEWIYPPKCVLCGGLLPLEKQSREVCLDCRGEMPWLRGKVCQKCGTPLEGNETVCTRCKEHLFVFQRAICVFPYGELRKGIKHFKFQEFRHDGVAFGKLMSEYLLLFYPHIVEQVDFMVPVPMYEKKKRRRGFNQSELLAEEISKHTEIPCKNHFLVRTRETTPQSELNPQERWANLQGAFGFTEPEQLLGKTVLLIDDIFTTGATANECAKMLYQGGAKVVIIFCLTIALDH